MSLLHEEPDQTGGGRPPLKGWVKVAGAVGIGAVAVATLFGLRHVSVFGNSAPPPPPKQAMNYNPEPFQYPPAKVEKAVAQVPLPTEQKKPEPVALPSEAPVTRHNGPTPLSSEILGLPPANGTDRPAPQQVSAGGVGVGGGGQAGTEDALAASLRPTEMDGASVHELPDPNFLISAGRLLPCDQRTMINTTHPGGVTAQIPVNVRGDTGDVTLLDKGTKIFGTIQHAMANGADTAFVLWQRFITIPLYDARGIPHEYSINVNSPASTEVGETGLPGDVNHHLGSKIPALIGVSLLQALPSAASAAIGHGNNGGTSLNFIQNGGQGVESAADSWLNRVLSVPDVLTRLQGTGCAVYVMRDLDMHAAYRLRQGGVQ